MIQGRGNHVEGKKRSEYMGKVVINTRYCKGCELCTSACVKKLIHRPCPVDRPEAAHFTETMAQLLAIIERRKTLHRSLSPRKFP